MEASFWHERWEENDIGFHLSETNPLLLAHFSALGLNKGQRVFVPLCGKTLDIHWLLGQGLQVAGAELSELAVTQLFSDLELEAEIIELENLKKFKAQNIEIYVGDIFSLDQQTLGKVDAVYDRAALVALPDTLRSKYTQHLMSLTQTVDQLLFCFDYDQKLMPGPPFSISIDEAMQHYATTYQMNLLDSVDLPEGLKGKCAATEHVWFLSNQ